MFSNDDIREIHQLFPPPRSLNLNVPSLVLRLNGQSFFTSQYLQTGFNVFATLALTRVPLVELTENLDVDRDTVCQLARQQHDSVLVSKDGNKIVPKSERDEIARRLHEALLSTFLSKQDFASDCDIDLRSLDALLASYPELVDHDELVCTQTMDRNLSNHISEDIDRVIINISNSYITPGDAEQHPGSPPLWLVLRYYKQVIQSRNLDEEVFLRESLPTRFDCQSRKLKAHNVRVWANRLFESEKPYMDLKNILQECPEIYESIGHIKTVFGKEADLEIVDSYALSEPWFQDLVKRNLQTLHHDGVINVSQQIQKEELPESLHCHIISKAEKAILSTAAEKSDLKLKIHKVGSFVLTEEQYSTEYDALLRSAKDVAIQQWGMKQANPDHELKFTLPIDNTNASPNNPSLQTSLLREKAIEKATDDQFWSTISTHESENESHFSAFWTERISSRLENYTLALRNIEDTKLQLQLAELLASYVQKELIPDTISKAQAQSLLLSRRTQKNIKRFEIALQSWSTSDVQTQTSIIDKFTRKQGISDTPDDLQVTETKSAMINDMVRRMQKQQQKKAADGGGPVLFLTLVIVLFARYVPGVVYATGKFAPKLLKLLKGRLEEGVYERIEGWKEAAKRGTLSAEDREAMMAMVGA